MFLLAQRWPAVGGAIPIQHLNNYPQAGPRAQSSSLLVQVAALAFALVYLLYPPLHATNVYEFHPVALAVPLLLFALHFMRQKRVVLFFIFVLLAMGTKEVIPLVTLALGFYILAIRREWVVGLLTIVVSIVWFTVAVFVVIPHFQPGGQSRYFALGYYSWLGDGGGEILVQIVTHPRLVLERFISRINPPYLAGLLGPVAYLPLLGLPVLLLAIPTLALNALSDESSMYTPGVYYHYLAPVIPFVILAAIDGASFLTRNLGRLSGRTLTVKYRPTRLQTIALILLPVLILFASIVAQGLYGYLPFSRAFYMPSKSGAGCCTGDDSATGPTGGQCLG